MKSVKVSVETLLKVLKKNREAHKNAIDEVMKVYREKVISELDKALKAAKEGREIITDLNLTRPLNMTSYYDRIIGMLEMSIESEVEITQAEYSNYILDKWSWGNAVSSSTASYSSSTSDLTKTYLENLND